MKRKLNQDDVSTTESSENLGQASSSAFTSLGLDSRLLQAVIQEGFSMPTLVQSKAIPLALEGKDISGASVSRSIAHQPLIKRCSSCKDRIWKDCCICITDPRVYPPSKGGMSRFKNH